MTDLLPDIRNTPRALIIRQDSILLLRKEGGGRGERFALPGGGQDTGETLMATLKRECLEEIGADVQVGELLHVAEFFKQRDTQPPTRRHLVEFLFRCTIADDYVPRSGHHPDKHQLEVVWADLASLPDLPLFPRYLSQTILGLRQPRSPHYLGSFQDHVAP